MFEGVEDFGAEALEAGFIFAVDDAVDARDVADVGSDSEGVREWFGGH